MLTCPPAPTLASTRLATVSPATKLWLEASGCGSPVGQTVRNPEDGRLIDSDVDGNTADAGRRNAEPAGDRHVDRLALADRCRDRRPILAGVEQRARV